MKESMNLYIKLIEIAKELLEDKIDYIVGSREITKILHELYDGSKIPDIYNIFLLIDSETDHLPVGSARNQWNNISLEEKDSEKEKIYELYKADIKNACNRIIDLSMNGAGIHEKGYDF